MRLLLDTHVVLAIINAAPLGLNAAIRAALEDRANEFVCSTVSLWEIAIKTRLGKLHVRSEVAELDEACRAFNLEILPILPAHVLADVAPEPPTRDPFDRLLLAQAGCERLAQMTLDRALADHPLAWRATSQP